MKQGKSGGYNKAVCQFYRIPARQISKEIIAQDAVISREFRVRVHSAVILFLLTQQPPPPSGPGAPHSKGFYITHNDAPQSVGLLWTSDRPVAETST
jgi:hypothetical protein